MTHETTSPQPGQAHGRGLILTLCVIFFVSGFPALIYQLVWQRSLFTLYGVNIESITVVVSAFMLGLGLGSFAGGALSGRSGVPQLLVFGLLELGIATFGLASLSLFEWVGTFTLGASTLTTGLYSFALVLVPTILMGATLPLLVSYLVNASGNVGRSVGLLYFVNTLGSAAACFAVALVLMRSLGLEGSVQLAAFINLGVGAGAVSLHFLAKRWGLAEKNLARSRPTPALSSAPSLIPFGLSLSLSAAAGFIALSYEILWSRVYGFVSEGRASAFPLLLGTYLTGIALGSIFVRRFCKEGKSESKLRQTRTLAWFILAVNVFGFLLIPAIGWLVEAGRHYSETFLLVGLSAAGLGATFPLICHLGIAPDKEAGARLSYLYLANIVGSTSGSMLTGFALMDSLSLGPISLGLSTLGIGLGGALLVTTSRNKPLPLLALSLLLVSLFFLERPGFHHIYEKLQFKDKYHPRLAFRDTVETKSGVISVGQDQRIYGGGKYDGRFSVSLVHDTNLIVRAYALSAFHPAPQEVLMIGLSSGSWAQVIAHHPQVKKLTIVEINEGYVELIQKYPEVRSLLENPKVEIIIDDGRRWLARHPEESFDAIVMNTSYNWRSHMSNLLSVEFLQLAKPHLKTEGLIFYNTTRSEEVLRTGATVFPHALRVINFMMASESPLIPDRERWKKILLEYEIDGRPVFDPSDPHHLERLDEVLFMADTYGKSPPERLGIETRAQLLSRTRGFPLVTDDNMGTEWHRKYL